MLPPTLWASMLDTMAIGFMSIGAFDWTNCCGSYPRSVDDASSNDIEALISYRVVEFTLRGCLEAKSTIGSSIEAANVTTGAIYFPHEYYSATTSSCLPQIAYIAEASLARSHFPLV